MDMRNILLIFAKIFGVIKKLLGQTALYGISSVLVRIFPFLIAPIITRAFSPAESAPFVDWYSIAGVVTVFLTHGMETSFFRFAQEENISRRTLVSTCSMSILAMSFIYLVLGWVFRKEITEYFHTPDQVHFLILFLFILSISSSSYPVSLLSK